eukprot:1531860-Rhodomonas_salina.2
MMMMMRMMVARAGSAEQRVEGENSDTCIRACTAPVDANTKLPPPPAATLGQSVQTRCELSSLDLRLRPQPST